MRFERDGQASLIPSANLSLSASAAVRNDSIKARIAKAAEIVADAPGDHFILWHELEEERHEIARQMPEAVAPSWWWPSTARSPLTSASGA